MSNVLAGHYPEGSNQVSLVWVLKLQFVIALLVTSNILFFASGGSQELLEGVEHERNIRTAPPRNSTIFHHPTLGNFELQHVCFLPVSIKWLLYQQVLIENAPLLKTFVICVL